MIKRRKSRTVKIGRVEIGGENPIAIQSMTNVDTRNQDALIGQIRKLEEAGCEIVRVAIPDIQAAESFSMVRKMTEVPLVADIHFDYRLAIEAIKAGADKIRINPGNIGSLDRVKAVVKEAKAAEVPIRIGVNSGSLEKHLLEKYGGVTAEGLMESGLENLRLVEDMGYDNLVVSIKSSNVVMNYQAHILLAEKTNHPIHVGITEAGTEKKGKVKSAVGIGSLLLGGIGDTIRVSLTGDPTKEVEFAKDILETLELRIPKFNLVSCPTCGRTEIDLPALAEEVERRLSKMNLRPGIKVAVMGCVVNGPGEAREADYGVCGGKEKGVILCGGEIVKTVSEDSIMDELIAYIEQKENNEENI